MKVSEQDFKYMTEALTSDLIQMFIDRHHCSLAEAVNTVYNSKIYEALLRPSSALYFKSPGYLYQYLENEIKTHAGMINANFNVN